MYGLIWRMTITFSGFGEVRAGIVKGCDDESAIGSV
jgi:hypothetical protein